MCRFSYEDKLVARDDGFDAVDGVLMDLGVSSQQLDDDDRGFSFRSNDHLDMRFDTRVGTPASEVVATYSETALADVFKRHGEEPHARRIARAIVGMPPVLGIGSCVDNSRILIACAYRPEEVAIDRDGARHALQKVLDEFVRDYGEVCGEA